MKFRLLNYDLEIVVWEGVLQNVVRFPTSIYFAGGFYLLQGIKDGRGVFVAVDCYYIPAAPFDVVPALIQPPGERPHETPLNRPDP